MNKKLKVKYLNNLTTQYTYHYVIIIIFLQIY